MSGKTKKQPANGWWQNFTQKLGAAFEGLCTYIPNPLKNLIGLKQVPKDRKALSEFRTKYYDKIWEEHQKSTPDFVALTKNISNDFRSLITKMIAEEVTHLGKAPCEFSLLALGSLARKECGPVTDLEIGFCIQEKTIESYEYFYKLSQRIADRLFLLGEHPDLGEKGLRLDEADNAPPYLKFFARNATPEQTQQLLQEAIENREFDKIPFAGSRAFIGTPEDFANYAREGFKQDKKALRQEKDKLIAQHITGKGLSREEENARMFWINQIVRPFSARENRIVQSFGTQLGRNITHVYGNRKLYNAFLAKRERVLSEKKIGEPLTQRQIIARSKLMKEDIGQHIRKGTSIFLEGTLGKTLDIKRELYRFVEQFVTNLGFYYKTHNQNTFDVVNELVARNILDSDFGDQLKDYIQFSLGLRLKKQAILKRQGFATYLSEEKFLKDKEDLEEKIEGLQKSIKYLTSAEASNDAIDVQRRQLFKLEHDLEHMIDMRPGNILSPEDIQKLETKYAPLAKMIFDKAQAWVKDPNALKPKEQVVVKPLEKISTASRPQDTLKNTVSLNMIEKHSVQEMGFKLFTPQLNKARRAAQVVAGLTNCSARKARHNKPKQADTKHISHQRSYLPRKRFNQYFILSL
ncbi:hypothetical protein CC99x_001265 [Candidatus Berkiella cookevillensis]|uniref:Protein-PII uridylyltransferase N-terminal domain-containing protein n=1 Tax=Candidatus Berkiella cookevillensis TaxID=437022 RepID=A0A0Q9YIM3_9GAMM|nr:DUF294 nucleotidyltransferase-like domain-containing protein [Candidatus Berkiella cookevillensis]MCS5707526.1 hypothetical protein [Candidatus Berkiella cookevillensis]